MLTHAHQSWSAHRLPGLGRRRRCEGRRARRLGPRRGSPRAWARMAGNSLACERAAAAGPACEARRRGRCGASPSLGSRRPRLTAGKRAPNSRRISPQTISRVHRANSNRNCRGSAPHDQRVQAAQLGAVQLRRLARHRPGPQRLRPPSRYLASHPNTVPPGHPQRGRHHLWMLPRLDLLHRPHRQHLERRVIQLAAVVLARDQFTQIA